MYIDTHCHLNFPQYDSDRAMVIGNAKKAGVKKFINPGVDLYSSKQAIELARKHQGVIFAAIGVHPYEAQHDVEINNLYKLYNDYKNYIVAVGECGLDYHQYKGEQALGKKDKQKRLFGEQLELAEKYNLPVIFHCRDAFDDFFDVLDGVAKPTQGGYPEALRGVIHCFSGGLQEVREAKRRGLFIGIDGNITYSKHLATIVPQIPLSMIFLETDAPYLTPVPHRGRRNEPKYIPLVAKSLANLLQISIQEVQQQTTVNAKRLFELSSR